MSVIKEIQKYVIRSYGNLISIEEPVYDSERGLWTAELKADYPRMIRDDSTNEKFLKYLSMEKLGRIYLTKNFEFKGATAREECISKIQSLLNMWRERAERIIIYASSDKLARLSEAKYVFSPIMQIISNFQQNKFITQKEIEEAPRKDRLKQYLKLLEGLDLASGTENGYTYGNLFTELSKRTENIKDLRNTVLSYVIRERYSTLRDVFKTNQFEPYVHVNSCYYKPSLEAEKLLYRKPDTIIDTYRRVYKPFPSFKLHHVIRSLIEVEAFRSKDQYVYGNEELFSAMLEMKDRLPQLSSPTAGE